MRVAWAVVLFALVGIASAVDISSARFSRAYLKHLVGDGGGGKCHDQHDKSLPGHQKCIEAFVGTGVDKVVAQRRCNCNGSPCKGHKCDCGSKSLGMSAWCYPLADDVGVVEPVIPDRQVGNDQLKIGWEIEFSNPVNCHANVLGNAIQCGKLGFKQTFATLNGWDLTTDNVLEVNGEPPAEVLAAINNPKTTQYSEAYLVEIKPHKPIKLSKLKAAMINLAKTYADMRIAPKVWLHDTPIPIAYDEEIWAESVGPSRKATADDAIWGQIDYHADYEKVSNSIWWVDNPTGFKPSGNPPQITMGFLLSEFNPVKNDFLTKALSPLNPVIHDPKKKGAEEFESLKKKLSGLVFKSPVSDTVIRNWIAFLFYFADRAVNKPPNKQAFDPLPKFDICKLSAKILADSGSSLSPTISALKIDPIIALMKDEAKVKSEIQGFLDKAAAGKACRIAPRDSGVLPFQALPNNDYLVVMELRNPTGPCVDLVNYNTLKLNQAGNALDETSTANFEKCWKALQ